MGFDTAYESISEETDSGHRWAFGTGFTDPLAGVDTSLPAGVDGDDLAAYCLMLGDDALILSHRLQQWLAKAPELEEETALANIALDLLGQARLLLTRAGAADGSERTEDDYAFGRGEREFRNVRLAEISDADFGGLIARLFVFSTWRLALLVRLRDSADPVLAAVAAMGIRELAYHRDYAAQWVIRLGDGTDYSRERMAAGLAAVAPLVPELFEATAVELGLAARQVAVDPAQLRPEFDAVLAHVLAAASLDWPDAPALRGLSGGFRPTGSAVSPRGEVSAGGEVSPRASAVGQAGRDGVHTEAMGYLLAELQSVARAMPGATW
jgi:ring-1,2-phenylacetyl-CoA epoxidase subunit PaaC